MTNDSRSEQPYSLGPLTNMAEEPAYVLERQPYKDGENRYVIWIKNDSFKVSPHELSKILGDTLQGLVEPTNKGKNL